MTEFADCQWSSRDGLQLHFRDYAGKMDRSPVICLHGLTRNARDFEGVAGRLAGEWRVICPDMRGRGDSAYAKDAETYNISQYVEDLIELLDQHDIPRFVAVGTSMGGLMAIMLAMTAPERLAGALLNDVGPKLEPAGISRISNYVGQGRSFETWMHAARALAESQAAAHPAFALTDWLVMAKRVMTLSSNGRIVFDYDMKIAEPFLQLDFDNQPDLWPGLEQLGNQPLSILRGETSDLLSQDTFAAMRQRLKSADMVTVPGVGHAPTLDEPVAAQAITRLLERVG